jgi:hypothetical protein
VALEAVVRRHPQVQAIACGHVHTTMTTAFAGRPLLICPSTNSTLRLDLRPRDDVPLAMAPQPLGFAVHALIDNRLVSHVQPLGQVADSANNRLRHSTVGADTGTMSTRRKAGTGKHGEDAGVVDSR